jgi:hypothetical protein
MESILKNKRGQIVDQATGVIVGIAVAIFIVFALLLGLSSLNPGSFFTSGSNEQNVTNGMVLNYTTGIGQFFAQIPTAMKVLGIVLILGFIGLLVAVVVGFRRTAGVSGGNL